MFHVKHMENGFKQWFWMGIDSERDRYGNKSTLMMFHVKHFSWKAEGRRSADADFAILRPYFWKC